MRRRAHRHPAIETAVFAAALLLAAFIARELWVRRSAPLPPPVAEPAPAATAVRATLQPAIVLTRPVSRTERAVTAVAPIKLTRVQRRKPKGDVVPAPK